MSTSANFVLVHGAFHGGWCWAPVAKRLRQAGHEVHTPTHTGLGERAHLMSGLITMETFVRDIELVLEMEDLEEVILVGHSYGARTIAGVADRQAARLRQLVFIDGGLPLDGLSRLEAMPAAQRDERIRRAAPSGGISIPPPPASSFDVTDPDVAAWVDRHLTPQPFGVEKSRLVLQNEICNGLPTTYLRCTKPAFPMVESSAAYARGRSDWRYQELEAGHLVVVTHPDLVADLLLSLAAESVAA